MLFRSQQDGGKKQEIAGFGDSSGASTQSSGRTDEKRPGNRTAEKGVPYPEWDYRDTRYKRNWSWVQEKKLAESNMAETNRLMNQYAIALRRLKKAIQAQKPTRLAPRLRQLDGEDMDINAVVGYIVEKQAGYSPKPAIYRRREMRDRKSVV